MGFADRICSLIDNTFDKFEDSISDVFNTVDNVIDPSTSKRSTTTLNDIKQVIDCKQEENTLPDLSDTKIGRTIDNAKDALTLGVFRQLKKEDDMPDLGDHIFAQRLGYTHHGIYIGDGRIIHYWADKVQIDTIDVFKNGGSLCVMSVQSSPTKYSHKEIINRAYIRLGEDKYNLIINNCEHFARWCRNGD